MSKRSRTVLLSIAAFLASAATSPGALRAATQEVEGWVDAVWVDEFGGAPHARREWLLHDDRKILARLSAPDAALAPWRGRRVVAEVELVENGAIPTASLSGIRQADGLGAATAAAATGAATTGNRRWINVLCRFSDSPVAPSRDVEHFEEMYSNAPHRLPEYWREASYGQLALTGTAAGWFSLPKTKAEYAWDAYPKRDYGALFHDCTEAADAEVDFTQFDGVSLFFEDSDERAFGGRWTATLDGKTRTWPVAWLTSSSRLLVVAHEMGHALGLPHSNNSDRDSDPYDSPWDMMSMPPSWCPTPRCDDGSCYEPGYGELPQQTIGYHRGLLGWLPAAAVARVDPAGSSTVTLAPLGDPTASQPRLIEVAIPGTTRFYTIEVRLLAGYDAWLPQSGVIIHEVDPDRAEPAWLVERSSPPADHGCTDGAVWQPGEEFRDASGVVVKVAAAAGGGYRVQVGGGGGASGPCSANDTTLCLDREPGDARFQVRAAFSTTQGGGHSGDGRAVSLDVAGLDRGGLFSFFAADNPEVFVKILDGCKMNGKVWVFLSAGTNVGFTVTVKDTATGAARQYANPDLKAAPPIQDTEAFPCS